MRAANTVLAAAAMATAVSSQQTTKQYIDPMTGFTFQSFSPGDGYRFGIVMPQGDTTDLIGQLTGPLNGEGGGWAGIDFGNRMVGPLLIVAWPAGDAANSVMISPRQAHGKNPDRVTVYTAQPIKLRQIAKGTFANGSHVTATFVCEGCINADSFDPKTSQTGQFAWAYSSKTVVTPGSADTVLSEHQERYGRFGVDLDGARSPEYASYAKLAQSATSSGGFPGPTTTTMGGGAGSTSSPAGGGKSGAVSNGRIGAESVIALTCAGALYAIQAFLDF